MSNTPALAAEYSYDVFISYSRTDEAWVRDELLQRLEHAGLEVMVDYRDFEPGAPLLTEMERAVLESRKTLIVLTPAYLKSEWTEFENILAQTLDPGARERRVVPVMLQQCELPLRIRSLVYVDLSTPRSSEDEFPRLLGALGIRDSSHLDTEGEEGTLSHKESDEKPRHGPKLSPEKMQAAFLRMDSRRHYRVEEPITIIGRAKKCHLEIPDDYDNVERYHATIFYKEGIFAIADGYENRPTKFGTFVNGVEVRPQAKVPLRHGDRIVLGGFRSKEVHELSRGACEIVFERGS